MPYQNKSQSDIPNWLYCTFCGLYETRKESNLLNHYSICEECNMDDIDDIKSYNIDENTTIADHIKQQINCIETTIKFIQTNELQYIENLTYIEIKMYIKNKLLKTLLNYHTIDGDIVQIYEFFFGKCNESQEDIHNQVMKLCNLY